jgi:hypothetical protein
MTYLDSIPKNPNPLNLVQANFVIKRMPFIAFFTQGVNIPGINMRNPEQETPLVNIPQQGDTLYYNELRVKFLVDEYMENWLELHTWMVALGFPESTDQHIEIASKPGMDGVWRSLGRHPDHPRLQVDSQGGIRVCRHAAGVPVRYRVGHDRGRGRIRHGNRRLRLPEFPSP